MNKIFLPMIFVLTSQLAIATEFQLFANKSAGVETLTNKDIKSIFLGRKTISENNIIFKPCYGNPSSDVVEKFFNEIIKKDFPRYVRYWNKKLFSGGGNLPKNIESLEERLNYVKNEKGAICLFETLPVDIPKNVIRVKVVQ